MNIIDIINKKREKQVLTKEELAFAVNEFCNNEVKDYQMSSLLMAICINGLSKEEIFDLTDIMLNSGERIDLSSINGIKVDKHSTGGIGDKTTLILAPLVASLGIPVAKMSGRGLGYTGGTIDKLESIPGFQVSKTKEEFIRQVNEIGVSVVGQTGNLVPADKKIYALRDVTGTVSSIPLIASSIMSKKLASGADKIVIDVKVGKGALLNNLSDARELAHLMVEIGSHYNKKTVCILTAMDEPLGCNIGNALEVQECIEVLQGGGSKDLKDLVITLASYMVKLGKDISLEDAKVMVIDALSNKKAYNKFLEFVNAQNGDLTKLTTAPKVFSIKSTKTGFIDEIDALKIGKLVHDIGGGRSKKEDEINYGVGVVITKKTGDFVTEGEELIKVYLDTIDCKMQDVLDCFVISDDASKAKKLIYEVIE